MRQTCLCAACILIVGVSAYLGAQPQAERVKVRLRLLDGATGKGIAGIVRVSSADSKYVELPGLFDRMSGLTKDLPGVHWYVVPAGGAETMLPRTKLQLEAVSGLETGRGQREVDLTNASPEEIVLKPPFLFHPEESALVAGNTHLHLRGFSLETADDYLRKIPMADGLRVLFISYLERHDDDKDYITNKYPIGPLDRFAATGVLFHNGEEHRHNFEGYGQGYGHVMFLNLKELVKPVSTGPGITGGGFDDLALRPGIDSARKQGGTVIWCHNTFGFEGVANVLTGRLDALNVFDGSRQGKYEDKYYRYLNIGVHLPISTGTDWFMYDFSRVYAKVPGKLTVPAWLDAVKAGRCQATNGPLLTLDVDGKTMGDVINLAEPKTLRVRASALGRYPLKRLELLRNGKVIKTQAADAKEPGRIELSHEARVEEPAWFAVRIDGDTKNEFDKALFAHSSPVYVNFRGRDVFDVDDALGLLKQVEEAQATIKARGRFSAPAAEQRMLALYEAAADDLRDRIRARR
jgi:hypothetical protein